MPDEPSSMLERKLATILSADVAGYSRLMAEDEEQTLRIFRGHREIFKSVVAMHRGRIFNTAGDAILAEFPSAVEAVRCATEIQTAVRTRNDQFPEARQVKFRIGVNLGDVMVQGGDLLGDGVNVAARLQAAAEPGGICISGSVYDQIRNKLSLSFRSLGERSFKNIPQPVRTFSITETEDHGALPARKRNLGRFYKWAAAAVLLILIAGAGYWAYSNYHRGIAAARRDARTAIERAEIRAQVEETLARNARAAREAALAREQADVDARRRDVENSSGGGDAAAGRNTRLKWPRARRRQPSHRGCPAAVAAELTRRPRDRRRATWPSGGDRVGSTRGGLRCNQRERC